MKDVLERYKDVCLVWVDGIVVCEETPEILLTLVLDFESPTGSWIFCWSSACKQPEIARPGP